MLYTRCIQLDTLGVPIQNGGRIQINLNNSIKELESIMKIVFQHNGVSLIAWQNWTNQFKKLKSFYGI
jgi:hypothetical protein